MVEAKRDARITEPFADGTYEFCLNYGAIKLLQESRDMGPMFLWGTLQSGAWRIEDIREIIRCGLIGGGMAPANAVNLVALYVETRPPMENLALAQRILGAGLIGAGKDEVLGEELAAKLKRETESTISPTVN